MGHFTFYHIRKKFDDICSRLDTIHERDGRTDGRTDDGRRLIRPSLRIASRGKNEPEKSKSAVQLYCNYISQTVAILSVLVLECSCNKYFL